MPNRCIYRRDRQVRLYLPAYAVCTQVYAVCTQASDVLQSLPNQRLASSVFAMCISKLRHAIIQEEQEKAIGRYLVYLIDELLLLLLQTRDLWLQVV